MTDGETVQGTVTLTTVGRHGARWRERRGERTLNQHVAGEKPWWERVGPVGRPREPSGEQSDTMYMGGED